MTRILIFFVCLTGVLYARGQNVYSYSVPTIEGNNQSLSAFAGKKILFITLPVQQSPNADSVLHALDSVSTTYSSTLIVIGTPAYEDGFTPANKTLLQQWYRSILNNSIVITDGLYTRKTSGTQQHPLYQWLTDKNKNGSFDQDVTGIKNKFIVWNDGALTSVLGAPVRINSTVINDLLHNE
ncbi:MAG: hypothetical protein JST86_11615 [Bacteroidetes bacterium]|nr:hypothetical protein [Bacteroidota bacterium]